MTVRILVTLLLLPFVTLPRPTSDYGIDPELFPIPEQLKPNVDFWIAVFSQYSRKQAILHDTKDLNIIYEVIDFSKARGDTADSPRLMYKKIRNSKRHYQKILLKLARIKPHQVNQLSSEEHAVYRLFEGQQTAARFRRASRSIRSQTGLKEEFIAGLMRSGKYFHELKRIFQKHGLPEALTCLPHVESSFRYKIYSRVGAAGMWQFTRRTGRRYLKINRLVDERIDPFYATEAAARLLKNNFQELGTWPLAITAYNHGVNGMARAVRRVKSTDFGEILNKYHSPSFRFASRNFYAEFLAAVYVHTNYERIFGNLTLEKKASFTYLTLQENLYLKTIAKKLELDVSTLEALNPSFKSAIAKSHRRLPKKYRIRIPYDPEVDYVAKFVENQIMNPVGETELHSPIPKTQQVVNTTSPDKVAPTINHRTRATETMQYLHSFHSDTIVVKPDETLGHFAEWLEIPAIDLRRLNRIPYGRDIYIGQKIRLLFKNVTASLFYQRRLEYHQNIENNFYELFTVKGVRIHQMKKGENIWELCNDFYEIPFWLLLKYNIHLELSQLKPGDEVIFPLVVSISENNQDTFLPGSDG